MELIMPKLFLIALSGLLFIGCSSDLVVSTPSGLPTLYDDVNGSEQKKEIPISVFRLQNYTDTPRAGMRAANIIEGVLKAKGYHVISHVHDKKYSLQKAYQKANADGSKYFVYGGVSEWRYKTGIDGEPAVSLQISLYDTKNKKLVWSATGSDSDWGNGSIGTTAQSLIVDMMDE